jgi:hypothetical protein
MASWDTFKQNLDPVMQAINEQNLGFGEILQLMADDAGKSLEQMGKDVEAAGITWRDTWGLVNSDLGKNLGEMLDNVKGATEGIKKEMETWQETLALGIDSSKITGAQFKEIGKTEATKIAFGRALKRQKVGRDIKAWEDLANKAGAQSGYIPQWVMDQLAGTIDLFHAMRPILQGGPVDFSSFEKFKNMGHGGIVTQPTLAMIGESGPEAVIPLGRGGGMGSMNVTVNIAEGAIVGVDDLQDTIAQTVRDTAERGGFRGVF